MNALQKDKTGRSILCIHLSGQGAKNSQADDEGNIKKKYNLIWCPEKERRGGGAGAGIFHV